MNTYEELLSEDEKRICQTYDCTENDIKEYRERIEDQLLEHLPWRKSPKPKNFV